MEILVFCAGVAWFYTHAYAALAVLCVALYFSHRLRLVPVFILGLGVAFYHDNALLERNMPLKPIATVQLTGEVVSIPSETADKSQFYVQVDGLNGKMARGLALLSCYTHCPHVRHGERWQFSARIKRPRNLYNPGAFDFERLMQGRHVGWTGYIRPQQSQRLSAPEKPFAITHWREMLADKLALRMKEQDALALVQALSLGVSYRLGKEQWQLFRNTGTTHLMVISGAHIGLVAGLCFAVVRRLWRLSSRLCLWLPASQAAVYIAIPSALMYTLLSGAQLSAQRAMVASLFVLLPKWLSRSYTAWQAWRYGLFLVVLFEPHAVLQAGFYFSFLAVALLLGSARAFAYRGIKQIALLQVVCLLGMLPLTLFWFSYGAFNSVLANVIAVPWVGYVLVPLSLMALMCANIPHMDYFFDVLGWAAKGLLLFLKAIDSFSFVNVQHVFVDGLGMTALLIAIILGLFFPFKSLRPIILLLGISSLWAPSSFPPKGQFKLHVLDVGQGLSVVVQTAKHTLIYDTGAQFFHGGDMGELAIVPYLSTQHVRRIDALVVSHQDLDHRGGLGSIKKNYPHTPLIVNDPAFFHQGKSCHTHAPWVWDGVSFEFLPLPTKGITRNNTSCILRIASPSGRVLLTGDIERQAEAYLIAHDAKRLAVDVLLVPHHGSKTSSSPAFLRAVSPQYAIIAAGFANRYRFPHAKTLRTYANQHIRLFNTMTCGMVSFETSKGAPECYT